MKITKADLLKKLNEGLNVNEIIDNHLNLIGTDDYVDTPEQVTTDATTDSYIDASRQQMGKNRLLATFLEEEDIVETNSDIQGKMYHVPLTVIQALKSKAESGDQEGSDRIAAILQNSTMNYEQVKRFKHDIENKYQGDWTAALTWINSVLATDRNVIQKSKETTMDTGMENRFRKTHDKDHNSNLTPLSSITEHRKVTLMLTEAQVKMLNESENYNIYKVSALREMLKNKKELLIKTKNEIKSISEILDSKIKNNIEENKN